MYIHFIAVGGAIMHQLAIALQNKGYKITGSDDEITDPAKTNLAKKDLLPPSFGWFPEKITKEIDAVILGMHAKGDNPEILRAKELGIPVYSFPEYIYEASKNKQRIVVAGSHGKTTTTSMIMHVLRDRKIDFDYLVGAKVEGFDLSVKISDAPVIILEGDEYPASVLEKRPKIHFYHPHVSVLTGIAWDHVNVFPTYEFYKEQFAIYLRDMQPESTLIYNAEDKEVVSLVLDEAKHLKQMPYATPSFKVEQDAVTLDTTDGKVSLQIFGGHNLQNMEAARKVCNSLGVTDVAFYQSIRSFTGAARRLEKINEREGFIAYRDFAHAPSKLNATLKAVRERYPDHYLIACFELHTFSSLSEQFLSQYKNCMDACDKPAVFYSAHALALKGLPALNPDEIKENFDNATLTVFNQKDALQQWIAESIQNAPKPVCLLLMSSGTFDGMGFEF
ncbi:peptidoglycan synthetase [Taibaiella lutea]|uniref:Peptidoglycan synthetase n=1 Tax=Taibaiella lutea TaxID=2608001 RepID=A0A5M6CMH3_9BACT|nr:Mur ligase family protein [Taibaiella lutea]KAA5536217.1 peptidoglycan synthetase [Taibaiella lutea]